MGSGSGIPGVGWRRRCDDGASLPFAQRSVLSEAQQSHPEPFDSLRSLRIAAEDVLRDVFGQTEILGSKDTL
jgi:hypothetical protein